MNADGVRCETRNDVLWLTLDRFGRRNAFDGAMLGALERALCELSPAVRAVVLTGAGTTFCAGADLEWMAGDDTLEDGVRPECAATPLTRAAESASPRSRISRWRPRRRPSSSPRSVSG
jgi:enoyl-CoA hydratase/carnithine racemase